MAINFEKMRTFLDSEEGKKSMDEWGLKMVEIEKREKREKKWVEKFNRYFETLNDYDFEILMENFTIWEEKYDDMWYDRGVLTYSNILSTLLDMAETYGTTLEVDEEDFLAARHEYRGFVFSVYHGQGTIIEITYNGKRIF
jgi:hypothetical protein|tara:strand:- start:15600 stop:16022 length:423 start_codon:yes stop_codon:yes gene_type:complete